MRHRCPNQEMRTELFRFEVTTGSAEAATPESNVAIQLTCRCLLKHHDNALVEVFEKIVTSHNRQQQQRNPAIHCITKRNCLSSLNSTRNSRRKSFRTLFIRNSLVFPLFETRFCVTNCVPFVYCYKHCIL